MFYPIEKMEKVLLQYLLFILLLIGFNGCVPTETALRNPNEKVYCDISTQVNGSNKILKSEVKFYVQDSLGKRPYFLDQPVWMNGKEMNKKFIGHKGIYYSLIHELDKIEDLAFSFTNLDDVGYDVVVPTEVVGSSWQATLSRSDILDIDLEEKGTLVIVDANNKIHELSNESNDTEGIELGNARMVQVVEKDSIYQLKGKLWVKYNSKSLSESKEIIITK